MHFLKVSHRFFSYLCSKKNKQTAHRCCGIKMLKHSMWIML